MGCAKSAAGARAAAGRVSAGARRKFVETFTDGLVVLGTGRRTHTVQKAIDGWLGAEGNDGQ